MKTLALALAAAATLIASSAFADEITGTIHTECLNGPTCFASITSIVGGVEHTTRLTGDFKQLGKLDGKIATVKGTSECLNGGDTCSMAVKSAKSAAAQPLTVPKQVFVTPSSVGAGAPSAPSQAFITPASVGEGSNVGRDASTTPILVHCQVGVGCTNTPVKSEGAGIKRN